MTTKLTPCLLKNKKYLNLNSKFLLFLRKNKNKNKNIKRMMNLTDSLRDKINV